MQKPNMLTIILITVAGTLILFNHYETRNVGTRVETEIASRKSSLNAMENEFSKGNFEDIKRVPELQSELDEVKKTLQAQMETFRKSLELADEARSRQAVARAKLAVLKGEVAVVRQQLQKLKTEQASWDARHASLMSGDQGRRIVGSPTHLKVVRGILLEERPSTEQFVKLQTSVDELAPLFEGSQKDPDAEIVVHPEHRTMISDALTWLNNGLAQLEQQNLLLTAVLKETAKLPPATQTLQELIDAEEAEVSRQFAENLKAAVDKAEAEANAEHIEVLSRLKAETKREQTRKEAEIQTAETQKVERERLFNEQQHAQEAELAKQEAAKEAEIREAEANAKKVLADQQIAEIRATADKAILELEFQRDLPTIKSHLQAFMTPGNTYRKNGDKGPVSLGYLVSEGVLNSDRKGIQRMSWIAHRENDRPSGAIPYFLGDDLSWQTVDKAPAEKAQALLSKYGQLLVEKKMLDP
jgi:hypothetical protein